VNDVRLDLWFLKLLGRPGTVEAVRSPLPWTVALVCL
jgi:hypothetical protein